MEEQELEKGEAVAEPEGKESLTEHDSHQHRSHHHSHRKHHRRRQRSLRHKLKSYYKKHKKQIIIAGSVLSLAAALLLGWLAAVETLRDEPDPMRPQQPVSNVSEAAEEDGFLYIGLPLPETGYLLTHSIVPTCLASDIGIELADLVKLNAETAQRFDVGLPAVLRFDIGTGFSSAGLELSEDPALDKVRYVTLDSQGRAEISHLKTGRTYYYRLTLKEQDGTPIVLCGSFRTEETPRILSIDGISNVRDIGGWKTTDGKRVRQGLLYRGTELDGAVEEGYRLTSSGIGDMTQVLGIRTDLDLRSAADAVPGEYVISGIRHDYYPIQMYEGIFEATQKETVRALFAELAKPATYPAYLHCTYGMDRTGTVCYLLEAVLGLSDEDLLREYELSVLHHQHMTRELVLPFIDQLQSWPGETTQQKAENFLLGVGVTAEELLRIRTIFLEDIPGSQG